MAVHDMYPSRTGREECIIERRDPVVYPSVAEATEGPLEARDVQFYADNGYLVLPEYMTDWVAPLQREIKPLTERLRGREELVIEPESEEPRTIFNPVAFSDTVDRFFRDPRIVDIVRQLLGSDVYRMQSRINIKPALKGKAFSWHSDFETWHVEDGMPGMRAVTAWIMLSENHHCNGPLYVIPGSHKQYISCAGVTGTDNYKTSLRAQTLGVPQPQTMRRFLEQRPVQAITGRAGTVVLHECNLLHASPDNLSGDARSIAMCVYNSVENKPVAPFSGLKPRPDFLSSRDTSPLRALEEEQAA